MSRFLRMIVFDLDCTLWPFHVDSFYYSPPFKRKNGIIVDKNDAPMKPYPEVLEVLEDWSKKVEIGIASRTSYPPGAESLLDLFGFNKYIKYKEIYPGCKNTHFLKLKNATNINYNEMLFFDDESRNIRDISKFGVECVLVDSDHGVTKKLVDDIVAKKFHGYSKV